MVNRMLQQDPKARPSLGAILASPQMQVRRAWPAGRAAWRRGKGGRHGRQGTDAPQLRLVAALGTQPCAPATPYRPPTQPASRPLSRMHAFIPVQSRMEQLPAELSTELSLRTMSLDCMEVRRRRRCRGDRVSRTLAMLPPVATQGQWVSAAPWWLMNGHAPCVKGVPILPAIDVPADLSQLNSRLPAPR